MDYFGSTGISDLLVEWATRIIESLGGLGVGLLIAAENLFPPIPSEVILGLVGFTAGQGGISLLEGILWSTAGSVAGALVLYYLGSWLGRERMYRIARKVRFVRIKDLEKTEQVFMRHEAGAIFFGRFIPIVRTLISIPAGIEKVPLHTFLLYTTLGSLIWNTTIIYLAYLLGDSWHVLQTYLGLFEKVVIVALVLFAIVYLYKRFKALHARRKKSPSDSAE